MPRFPNLTFTFCALCVAAALGNVPAAQAPSARASQPAIDGRALTITYRDAKPILDALRADLLPPPFREARDTAEIASRWDDWVARHDAEIRARVTRGDEDSVLNLLLFGTSFTDLPRATELQIADMSDGQAMPDLIGRRIAAFIDAIAAPRGNERMQFAASVVARDNLDPSTPAGRAQLHRWLSDGVSRTVAEYGRHAAVTHDPGTSSIERSTLYRDRGLASDTSIFPGFGVEQTLDALKSNGLLAPRGVRRVAIVGPGLDFADKREGHDFYPQQTIQPFATIDSLRRLGLPASERIQVTTLDLSPRVNTHVETARMRARAGEDYVVQLPRSTAPFEWTPFVLEYWRRFGNEIGEEVKAIVPGIDGVLNRAVRVRPDVVEAVVPRELNIVLQRLAPTDTAAFDIVLATNVLIYYDVFDQSLALHNVAAMLRPGGFFLTNTPVTLLPSTPFELLGYTEVGYTNRPEGDRFFWYRRL